MIYLSIRTDTAVAELSLYDETAKQIATMSWEAGRSLAKDLLKEMERFLHENATSWVTLDGLIVFQGPGSFTGLRIGITVANTIAYAQSLPIVGQTSDSWIQLGCKRLASGDNNQIVLPFYGAEPRITTARK